MQRSEKVCAERSQGPKRKKIDKLHSPTDLGPGKHLPVVFPSASLSRSEHNKRNVFRATRPCAIIDHRFRFNVPVSRVLRAMRASVQLQRSLTGNHSKSCRFLYTAHDHSIIILINAPSFRRPGQNSETQSYRYGIQFPAAGRPNSTDGFRGIPVSGETISIINYYFPRKLIFYSVIALSHPIDPGLNSATLTSLRNWKFLVYSYLQEVPLKTGSYSRSYLTFFVQIFITKT